VKQNNDNHKEYITTREAAKLLGLSPVTLSKWRSQNEGPNFYRINNRNVRYSAAELGSWLKDMHVNIKKGFRK